MVCCVKCEYARDQLIESRCTYDVDGPGREVALLDVLEELLGAVVWVGARELACLLVVERLEALIRADVNLDVVEFALLVDPLEGMPGIAVLAVVAVRRSAVGEQDQDLVNGFGVLREVVLGAYMALERAQDKNITASLTQNMSASFKCV